VCIAACELGANSLINSSFASRLDYELIPAVWSSAAIPPHHRPDSTSIEALIASYRAFSAVLSVFGSNWGYLVLGRKKTHQRSEGECWWVRSMIDRWGYSMSFSHGSRWNDLITACTGTVFRPFHETPSGNSMVSSIESCP